MAITQTYQIDMTPGMVPAVVHLSQYDTGGRTLEFVLYAGSTKYAIPSGSIVTIRGSKSDGTVYEYEMTINDNIANVAVTSQMTAIAGWHPAEIRIYNGTTVTGSANIRICVEPSPFPESYKVSASDIPIIEGAEQAASNAQVYENRASQYATNAANSATSAGNSATAAASSASAASASQTAAAASATAAAASEKNAMSATPDGYSTLADTFNSLGLYVDSDGYICQALDGETQD